MPTRVAGPKDTDTPPPEPDSPLKAFVDVFAEDWASLPLAGKMAKIMGAIGTIPKSGYNQIQHYRFSQETDLVGAIRPYLSAAGIIITFSVTKHEILARQNPDAKGMLTHVTVHYVVTDGKDRIEGDMDGYGMDAGDKGVYKAITGAKKYVLMTLFLVDTGDDPEADSKTDKLVADEQRSSRPSRSTPQWPVGVHPAFGPELDLDDAPMPTVGPLRRPDAVRGGRSTQASDIQRDRLIDGIRRQNWSARQFLAYIRKELSAALVDAPEDDPARLRAYLNTLLDGMSPEDMGILLVGIEREHDQGDSGY